MKMEQLEQLLLIEKFGSVSKAAREMYIAQSALSNNLNNLENEIGVRLFERSPMGVVPTAEGKEIIKHARTILSERDQILNYGKNQHTLTGEITIILTPAYQYLYSKIILLFEQRLPNAKLHLKICNPKQLYDMLLTGSASAGLLFSSDITLQNKPANLKTELFSANQVRFFVGQQHPLASKKDVSIDDIAKERLLAYSEYHSTIFKAHRLPEQKISVIEDMDSLMQMLADGMGVCSMPERAVFTNWRYQQGQVIALDLSDNIGNDTIVYSSKQQPTLLEQQSIALLREILSTTSNL